MGESPAVADSAPVSEMAYVVGNIDVGERASLWPFVCLCGDHRSTVVGEATNLQAFPMLHGAHLGDQVTVGHNAVINNADVGDDD
jgi:carbonic anhydrase/acetyltransferase-like protein (isoleucine patch superfamily)